MPVWPTNLSVRLPVFALVSYYLTNKLVGLEPLSWREPKPTFTRQNHSSNETIRYYPPFPEAIPVQEVSCPSITHPFAALLAPEGTFALDLHA